MSPSATCQTNKTGFQ